MKITIENYKKYIPENDQSLILALLIDLEELNKLLDDHQLKYKQLYIDYQDYHDEYSPERTDPCPDYYGTYTLRFEKNEYETCGINMDINELDTTLCTLINFEEFNLG